MKTRNILIVAGVIAAAASAPALAAPVNATKDASGKALILIPLTVTKVQDLDFGSVIPSASSGSVNIPAAGGPRTPAGGVTLIASDPGFRAIFAGAGSQGELVNIFLSPPPSVVDPSGDVMPIALSLETNMVTIGKTRSFLVGVGGTISVGANQPDGIYTGTFTVLAQYN